MKKLFILLAALCMFSISAQSQTQSYCYAKRDTCNLYMDIYRAQSAEAKPAVMFLFGGGFISGTKDQDYMVKWYKTLVENGYTAIAIDYRLGMKDYKMDDGLSGLAKASDRFKLSQDVGVEDALSAVQFLMDNREELGIDPYNLVLSGSSAGAIISLATEYEICCGRMHGLPEDFNFKGVMSFAGGIISTDGAPKFKKEPCPILFLHGTADQAVAYKTFSFAGRGIWGSNWIAKQLSHKGWDNYCIYRFQDSYHDVAAYMSVMWDVEEAFLEKNVMRGTRRHVDATLWDNSLPVWSNISVGNIYQN